MEPKFVVKTTLNFENQLEASKAVGGKLMRIVSYVLDGIVLALIGLMVYLIATTQSKKNWIILLLLVAAGAYLVFNQFFAQKRALRKWEAGVHRNYGVDEIHLTTEFFDLILVQSNDLSDDVIEEGYSGVNDFRETEHLFLLQCRHKNWFFVDKAGFVTGTPEAFRTFFAEKK